MLPGLVRVPHGAERHFGKFTLIIKLGWGGMADVYLAVPDGAKIDTDARMFRSPRASMPDGPLLVVKRLKSDLAYDGEYRAMFKDESKLALLLDHANIVKAVEVGEIDGQPFLSMEYLDGQPLDRILDADEKNKLSRAEILFVMSNLLAGLQHAHELRDASGKALDIVHRDISPHNVFVTYSGRVKLVDFGIAKSRIKNQHTSTGVVKGKIEYMAPEQALCSQVDKRADVFAAGVILWELITGRRFWGELSDVQILKTMTFGELPSLEEHLPNASPELVRICGKALAITPEQRYGSAEEFRADIEAFIDRLGERIDARSLSAKVDAIGGDQRRALDHAIAQQLAEFGPTSGQRDDTPLSVEIPASFTAGLGVGSDPTRPDPMSASAGPPSRQTQAYGSPRRDDASSGPASLRGVAPVTPAGATGAQAANGAQARVDLSPRDAEPKTTLDTTDGLSRTLSGNATQRTLDESVGASGAGVMEPVPVWQAPARRGRSRWPIIAAVSAVVLAAVTFGATKMMRPTRPDALAAADTGAPIATAALPLPTEATSSPSGPTKQASSAAPSDQVVNVTIAIEATSNGTGDAVARLDGTLLGGLPFTAKFPRDGLAHKLTIEREGAEPYLRMLVFDHDIDVSAALEPAKAGRNGIKRYPPRTPPAPTSQPTAAPRPTSVADTSDPWGTNKKKRP